MILTKTFINELKLMEVGRKIFYSNWSRNLENPGINSFKPLYEV
jgi:hypothetical protein